MAPMKKPAEASHKVHSLTHLARRWRVSRREVRRLLQSGKLGFEQICGEICVPESEVRRYERSAGLSA